MSQLKNTQDKKLPSWLPRLAMNGGPRYLQIADALQAPIATFAPERGYYIARLSKCLTPGLRVAFVLIPAPQERERFLAALRSFALMATPLTAALATQWILDGSADRLMEGIRNWQCTSECNPDLFG